MLNHLHYKTSFLKDLSKFNSIFLQTANKSKLTNAYLPTSISIDIFIAVHVTSKKPERTISLSLISTSKDHIRSYRKPIISLTPSITIHF